MFRLDKKKIFLLYQYYLLDKKKELIKPEMTDRGLKRFAWLKECWEKESFLQQKISKNLKESWDFSRLPPLEKAILIYATHELFFGLSTTSKKMLLDQIINFSKAYLEEGKHKYINKNLDLSWKDLSCLNVN